MIIDRRTLESICEQLSEKFHLYEYAYHLAAVFENNDSREIVSWAVLDEDNQIVDVYNEIEDIEKEYMEDKNKINNFYLSFIRQYRNCFPYHIERCIIEEYRNNLSRLFKIPSGHRWQYKEWYPIQEYAMQLLVNDGFISKESKEFYCKPIK